MSIFSVYIKLVGVFKKLLPNWLICFILSAHIELKRYLVGVFKKLLPNWLPCVNIKCQY